MAIKINKVQSEAVTPTPPKQDAGTSSVKNSTPIDFKSQKTENSNQSEVVKYINTDEFKNLSKQERFKLIKAKFPFLKDLSAAEINSYIASAKESVASKTTKKTEETTSTNSTNELEKLALEYKKKNNIKGEIDNIIASLKSKQTSGEKLSKEEKRILDLFEQPKNDQLLIPMDKLLSKEFQILPQQEKLATITTAYLEKHDKNFQKLSEEDKKVYLAEKMEDIANMVTQKGAKSSKANENKAGFKALLLLQIAHSQGKSIEELKNLPEEERNNIITKAENEVIKQVIGLVEKDKLQNVPNSEKVNVYADTILSLTDPEYAKIENEADRKKYRDEKIDEFIINNFEIDEKKWKKLTPETKAKYLEDAATVFSCIIQTTKDGKIVEALKNYKNLSIIEKNNFKIKCYEEGLIPDEGRNDYELARLKLETHIREKLAQKGINNPTDSQINSEIQRCTESGEKLPVYVRIFQNEQEKCKDMGYDDNSVLAETNASTVPLGQSLTEYVKQQYADCNNKNIQEYENEIKEYVKIANGRQDEIEVLRRVLLEQGISEDKINEYLFTDESVSKMCAKASNADGFNAVMDMTRGCNSQEIVAKRIQAIGLAPKWHDNDNTAKIVAHVLAQDATKGMKKGIASAVETAMVKGLHEHKSKKDNKEIFGKVCASAHVPDSAKATFTRTFIQTAKSDQDRVYYSKSFSTIKNPAVTEGLAAASKYVKDPAAKQQYNHYVEVAAQSYPPEVQATIKTALKTGEISAQTLAKTTPEATSTTGSEKKAASANTTNDQPKTGNTNPAQQNTAGGTAAATQNTPTAEPRVGTYSPNIETRIPSNNLGTSFTNNSSNTTSEKTNYIQSQTANSSAQTNIRTNSSANSTSTETNYNENYRVSEEKANLQLKEAALENIAEVKENIDNSIKEWELKHSTSLSDETVSLLKDIAATEAIEEYAAENPSEREIIIENLSKAQSVGEVYNILVSALGSKVHDKFIEVLASYGSADNIRSFVNSQAKDSDIIKKMYLRCSSETLKSELLNMLPESTIREMLEKGDITTLDAVDHKVLYSFLLKNLYSMTSTTFAGYLKHLPLDERMQLTELRNKSFNLDDQPQHTEVKTNTPDLAAQTAPAKTQQTAQPNQSQATQKENKTNTAEQPLFAHGETIKTLDNGNVITNQGTTFAGISNNTYDEEYRVVNNLPDKKEGSPIGMNDEVLTPGSEEWKRKYNKQQEPPKTAFTMAALEEDYDEFGMPFGSTKVGMGQKIKKKYPPQSFRFNA